jgi:hypothetical protein
MIFLLSILFFYVTTNYKVNTQSKDIGVSFIEQRNTTIEDSDICRITLTIDSPLIKLPIEQESILMTLSNPSDNWISYSTSFTIENASEAGWMPLTKKNAKDRDIVFPNVLLYVRPHSSTKVHSNLLTELYDYQPGKYRIKKKIWNKEKKTESYLYAEFIIINSQ